MNDVRNHINPIAAIIAITNRRVMLFFSFSVVAGDALSSRCVPVIVSAMFSGVGVMPCILNFSVVLPAVGAMHHTARYMITPTRLDAIIAIRAIMRSMVTSIFK